jgi:uncharacterized protein (TIGR03437 family)
LAALSLGLLLTPAAAQLNPTAFRVLGQPDLRQNGLNFVEGSELAAPSAIALDSRGGELHLYVADAANHRVLGWRNANAYQAGAKADLVLGQPNLRSTVPLGIGVGGLVGPLGIAVHAQTGHVYVADTDNHRVLRFPSPFENPGRVEPDRFYGQPNLSSRNANAGGLSERTMNGPSAVAFDRAGNLWVADRGNHRVLRIPAGSLDAGDAPADLVLGQANFFSNSANRGTNVSASGFNTPLGLAFDNAGALYVSDFTNARILVFNAPQSSSQAANRVLGQATFESAGAPPTPSASTLRGPVGIDINSSGSLYVSIPLDHRVVVFNNVAQAPAGASADRVVGQAVLTTGIRNINTHPKASAEGLNAPSDVAVDSDGNLFVCDGLNHRVLAYPNGAATANRVWGQPDFTRNSPNGVEAGSISGAYQMLVDYTTQPCPLYVSDTNNHRILIWRDSTRFVNGSPADLVIGQPDLTTAVANVDTGAGQTPSATSLAAPRGIALDAAGNLLVADTANNRVLRFPRPVDQSGRITADLVLGQNDFFSSVSASVSSRSLRAPSGVAFDSQGNLFVSDTGNNRVLQFGPNLVNTAAAVRVFGQNDFFSGAAPGQISAESLFNPEGVFVDLFGFLYVADTGAHRVLIYPNAAGASETGASASIVLGQPSFGSFGNGNGPGRMNNPRGVSTDASGKIYVSDSSNHRVLIFSQIVELPIFGAQATGVVGQPNLNSGQPNFNSSDGAATPQALFAPVGVFVDRNSTLYVGDTGNSRLLHFLKPGVAVNAAHFLQLVPVAPGSLVSLFGVDFTEQNQTGQATQLPLPTEMAGRRVEVTPGVNAPLLYVSAGQINLQVPVETPPGTQGVAVRRVDTNELLAGGVLSVLEAGPGFFTAAQNGTGQALALNQNGSLNGPSNPATRGSVVSLFGTGQGPVDPAVASGQAAPSAPPFATSIATPTNNGATCLSVQPSVCIAVGSTFGDVLFSGLAPGFVGLWQMNVRIPDAASSGDAVPIRAVIRGRPSNVATLAIQ